MCHLRMFHQQFRLHKTTITTQTILHMHIQPIRINLAKILLFIIAPLRHLVAECHRRFRHLVMILYHINYYLFSVATISKTLQSRIPTYLDLKLRYYPSKSSHNKKCVGKCTYYICPDIIAFIQTLYYTSTRPVNKTDST